MDNYHKAVATQMLAVAKGFEMFKWIPALWKYLSTDLEVARHSRRPVMFLPTVHHTQTSTCSVLESRVIRAT
ncbi:Protein of unknown function [Pyronema omphalodes CBS 100304]|uniref:Uncharacterized protein n=1 Tax=Pyronema omphalodes (strain CBS 100304) TaxID=1076935 RepID=U4KXR1_PYROM|nr:Protein of unknown function [Pyronema omphalodes CBS 100304]